MKIPGWRSSNTHFTNSHWCSCSYIVSIGECFFHCPCLHIFKEKSFFFQLECCFQLQLLPRINYGQLSVSQFYSFSFMQQEYCKSCVLRSHIIKPVAKNVALSRFVQLPQCPICSSLQFWSLRPQSTKMYNSLVIEIIHMNKTIWFNSGQKYNTTNTIILLYVLWIHTYYFKFNRLETDQKPLFPIRHHHFVSLWRNKQSVLFNLKSDLGSLFHLPADLSSCPLTFVEWMKSVSPQWSPFRSFITLTSLGAI